MHFWSVRGLSPFSLVILASGFAWAILFVAIGPEHQNFPLNDDWAFARGAVAFASGEGIHYAKWAAMPQLGQWLWAAPFIWIGGPTHTLLRISTIVLSWLGLWAFYDLLRQHRATAESAAWAAATLALNPLFFLLEGTFMTDVPALSFALLALALYGRALSSGRMGFLIAAAIVACLAVSTRQNTMVVLVVAALWAVQRGLMLIRGFGPASLRAVLKAIGRTCPGGIAFNTSLAWFIAIVLPLAAGLAIQFWFRQRPDVLIVNPAFQSEQAELRYPFMAIMYVGLAALPLVALNAAGAPRLVHLIALAGMAAWTIAYYRHDDGLPWGGLFPYTMNMITPQGAFTDAFYLGQRPEVLTRQVRVALTVLAALGAAGLLTAMWSWVRRGLPWNALVAFGALQIPLLLLMPPFDRYMIFLMPAGFALLSTGRSTRLGRVAAGLFLLAYGSASVGLMHDWLAWHSARWDLGRWAERQRIPAQAIEGGFEWDGDHTDRTDGTPPRAELKDFQIRTSAEWFPRITGEYCLSSTPYRDVRASREYRLWLAPGKHAVYLLGPPERHR